MQTWDAAREAAARNQPRLSLHASLPADGTCHGFQLCGQTMLVTHTSTRKKALESLCCQGIFSSASSSVIWHSTISCSQRMLHDSSILRLTHPAESRHWAAEAPGSWVTVVRVEAPEDLVIVDVQSCNWQALQKVAVQSAAWTFSAFHKREDDGEGGRLRSDGWEVLSHSGVIYFYLYFDFLLPINTTFSTSSTLFVIFHLFVFICHTF